MASAQVIIATPLSWALFGAWCRICGEEKSSFVMTFLFFETVVPFEASYTSFRLQD